MPARRSKSLFPGLGRLGALLEDLESVPSTHIRELTTALTLVPRIHAASYSYSRFLSALAAHSDKWKPNAKKDNFLEILVSIVFENFF